MELYRETLVAEFWYDSEEERAAHVEVMEQMGWECTGRVRECRPNAAPTSTSRTACFTHADSDHSWYAKYIKHASVFSDVE